MNNTKLYCNTWFRTPSAMVAILLAMAAQAVACICTKMMPSMDNRSWACSSCRFLSDPKYPPCTLACSVEIPCTWYSANAAVLHECTSSWIDSLRTGPSVNVTLTVHNGECPADPGPGKPVMDCVCSVGTAGVSAPTTLGGLVITPCPGTPPGGA